MRDVWIVSDGEYSDYSVQAVCSSYEQACGVAVMHGLTAEGAIKLWEPEDGIPPYKPVYSCIVRLGPDSSKPLDIEIQTDPIKESAAIPEPQITTSNPAYRPARWARAANYATAEEAEAAAREAFGRVSLR